VKSCYVIFAVAVALAIIGHGATASSDSKPVTTASAAAAIDRIKELGGKIKLGPKGQVVEVNLEASRATDDDVARLAPLGGIRKLKLWGAAITNKSIATLAGFPELVDLTLFNTRVDDRGIAALAEISTLRNVNLRRTTGMTNEGLAHLRGASALETLGLSLPFVLLPSYFLLLRRHDADGQE